MRQSLKQFVFEKMEKSGWVSDSELAEFQGKEPNWCQAEVYKSEYLRRMYNLLNKQSNVSTSFSAFKEQGV